MNQQPTTPNTDDSVCFGVCCDQHAHCARYLAVGYRPTNTDTVRLGTCQQPDGARPLFVWQPVAFVFDY